MIIYIYMSILEAAYREVLAGIKNWEKQQSEEKLNCLQLAYSLIGRPFLEALTQLERSPEEVHLY